MIIINYQMLLALYLDFMDLYYLHRLSEIFPKLSYLLLMKEIKIFTNGYRFSLNQSLYFYNYFGPIPKTNMYLLSYIQQYPIKHLTHLPPSKLFMFPESISCRPLPINNVELLSRKNQSQCRLGMKVNLLRNVDLEHSIYIINLVKVPLCNINVLYKNLHK